MCENCRNNCDCHKKKNVWQISFTDEFPEYIKQEEDLYEWFKQLMEDSLKYEDLTGFEFKKIS